MKPTMPSGLRWIQIISIIFLIFSIVALIFTLATPLRGLQGFVVLELALIFSIALYGGIIIAIKKADYLWYKIIMVLLIADVVITFVYAFNGNILQIIPSLLFTLLILWYIYKVKAYFTGKLNRKDAEFLKVEKTFKITFIVLLVAMFVIPFVIAIVQTTQSVGKSNILFAAFENNTVGENIDYCSAQENTDECMLYLAIHSKAANESDPLSVCRQISDEEYSQACYLSLGECDFIVDDQMKEACITISALS